MEPLSTVTAGVAVTKAFTAAAERAEKKMSGIAKDAAIKAIAALKSYAPYLEETYERVSTFKTFADPSNFVAVADHFVSPTLSQESSEKRGITDNHVVNKIERGQRLIVSARAGYGKSMLMKYICLTLFENPRGVIPIFMELRHINRHKDGSLIGLINKSYRRTSRVEVESLRQGLKSGAFCLVLDGFDEVHFELRDSVEHQILELSREFTNCPIIISGRPNEKYQSWRGFEVWNIDPMTKPKVVELLKKLNYRRDVVNRFVKKINTGVYESHQSFMSTPLLSILMLLSYEQNANIPDKMHLFYAEAFKTLFHKHDATKDQYERSRRSSLQIDDFQDVFSVFCLKTYVLEKTEFDSIELRKHIKDALQYFKKTELVDHLLFDFEEAVCLLMNEGSSYFFVHRSFQEYFTAVFLSNCPVDIRDDFLNNIAIRRWDGVLSMLFDMAKDQLESSWISQNCDTYLDRVSPNDDSKIHPLGARWPDLTFGRNSKDGKVEFIGFSFGEFSHFLSTMEAFYPRVFDYDENWNYEDLRKFVKSNWDIFPVKDKGVMSDDWELRSIEYSLVPHEIVRDSIFSKICVHEYEVVRKIREAISSELKERSSFIDKLFSHSS